MEPIAIHSFDYGEVGVIGIIVLLLTKGRALLLVATTFLVKASELVRPSKGTRANGNGKKSSNESRLNYVVDKLDQRAASRERMTGIDEKLDLMLPEIARRLGAIEAKLGIEDNEARTMLRRKDLEAEDHD